MDVDSVIAELYGLRPAEFVAARDAYAAQARRDKDAATEHRIAALPKPTLAVWAANILSRTHPREAESLIKLGGELQRAHRNLDGAQLRTLSHQHHQVITTLAREAAGPAAGTGERITDPVLRQLEQILHTLLTDPDAGADWIAGHLTTPPAPAGGFTGLEPAPGTRPPKEPRRPPARTHAEEPPGPADQKDDGRARVRHARREAAQREAEAARIAEAPAQTAGGHSQSQYGTGKRSGPPRTLGSRRQGGAGRRLAAPEGRAGSAAGPQGRRGSSPATERLTTATLTGTESQRHVFAAPPFHVHRHGRSTLPRAPVPGVAPSSRDRPMPRSARRDGQPFGHLNALDVTERRPCGRRCTSAVPTAVS
ncbi:hypothetical protein [Streptomyces sp. NPDC090445]|uniref:hypothetical protein n=1 Tax=Streptomyces sp. NPDC090445 TaxID=3365963 RepID=UPI00381D2797